MTRHVAKLVALIVVLLSFAFIPSLARAVEPDYPANIYIQNVDVANPSNPLDYYSGGVRILLTRNGDNIGLWWNGAWALASFTIDSWQRQTGRQWPYHWRSHDSVAREIQAHCWRFDTTRRPTTISFSGW